MRRMTLWARSGGQLDPHLVSETPDARAALVASLNGDLLEDFDGAPFPDEVQAAFAVRIAGLVPADAVDAERLLIAWRRTKDFLRDRLVKSGRRDVNVNAVLREMNSAFEDPLDVNET